MMRVAAPRPAVERLAEELFDGSSHDPISDEIAAWLAGSRRFRSFVEAHRVKIRKKLRGASDIEARRDVRAELGAAYQLLIDRRMGLAFEAYGSGKGGPDFTVTFRGEQSFNVEVTRLRRAPDVPGDGGWLLTKLRQLPPSAPNAVLVATGGASAEAFDVAGVVRTLRARADAKDDAFFTSRGLDGTRGFHQRYRRLGAVMVWCEGAAGDARAALWSNPSARIPLPERAARACLQCLRAG
jgi:hypothetical protein